MGGWGMGEKQRGALQYTAFVEACPVQARAAPFQRQQTTNNSLGIIEYENNKIMIQGVIALHGAGGNCNEPGSAKDIPLFFCFTKPARSRR